MKRIFLVDISSFIFRAFYAIRQLTSPSGVPTNAVYGTLTMLIKLLKDYKPDYVVVCYDRKEPSFRKDLYTEYKANRSEMPEDLIPQIPIIKKLIELFGIPSVEAAGFEADDIIGTLARIGKSQGLEVHIVSGDKDFAQVVSEGIFLVDTMKDSKMGPAEVLGKWGVNTNQFIDYLALMGDSSDNIPGVPGIGPKGAVTLLTDFGSLDGIYQNLSGIKSASLRGKLETGKDLAYLSQKLVTINTEVPVSENLSDYQLRPRSTTELTNLLRELNFKSLDKSLAEFLGSDISAAGSIPALAKIEAQMSSSNVTESTAIGGISESSIANTLTDAVATEISELAGIFSAGSDVWVANSETGIFLSDGKRVLQLQGEQTALGKLASELNFQWRGYDLKPFLHTIGAEYPKIAWDGMLAAYVLRAGEPVDFSSTYTWLTGQSLGDLPTGKELIAAQLHIFEMLGLKLADSNAKKIFEELELPLVAILFQMERKGIHLDSAMLQAESQILGVEIKELETKIHELSGTQFNIASPKQLAQVLFEKMNLTPTKKTKTGYSTDSDVLDKLKNDHPIINEILQYRELTKLKSTYVDALPLLVKQDGRIHTTFKQALTTTGRLSSVDPNLQNIPIKTARGAQVRRAFTAQDGLVLLSVDYSQIELRILAHYTSDKNLVHAFANDLDIHAATASEVFNVSLESVTSEMRRAAKAINFGIAYGQGAFGLAENLGIPRGEAQDIIKRYFSRFPGVQEYISTTVEKAKEAGFVETIFGRRRYINELKSGNPVIRKFGERAAINAPIQGSASDIVKKAMIEVARVVKVPMILQVHDELIFEGSSAQIENEKNQIKEIMETIVSLKVPLKINSAIGKNWGEAH